MVYNFSFSGLLDTLLPVSCALCQDPTHSHLPVCRPCLDDFPTIHHCCNCCALPLGKDETCGDCQKKPPEFDQVHTLFHYHVPVTNLIQQLKYNDRLEFACLFGELLGETINKSLDLPDLLIPVPLHAGRLRQRGYNQSWEIAKAVHRKTGIRCSRTTCKRSRKTELQTGLSAADRKRNLRQAFSVSRDVMDSHICIVDDVMTTGSTLNEMARSLKRAGARKVSGLVVARVVA